MPYNQTQNPGAFIAAYILVILLVALVTLVFSIVIYWKIFAKAGYNGAMGLLMFVPVANIVVLCILAFGTWPIYEELDQLRQRAKMVDGQSYSQGSQPPRNPQYR